MQDPIVVAVCVFVIGWFLVKWGVLLFLMGLYALATLFDWIANTFDRFMFWFEDKTYLIVSKLRGW